MYLCSREHQWWILKVGQVKSEDSHSFEEVEMLQQRLLVILPPLLLLLSCLLTVYYILPKLSQAESLPSPLPSQGYLSLHSNLPSCENVSSLLNPTDVSLWQMLMRPLLAALEVTSPSYKLYLIIGCRGALLSHGWISPLLGEVSLLSIWSFLSDWNYHGIGIYTQFILFQVILV